MTYSKDKIAGLSVADAIGLICTSATDASRWAGFQGVIELSERHTVSVGEDHLSFGCQVFSSEPDDWTFGRPEPEKSQREIDAQAYAAALRPLVDDLAAGELVVTCWDLDSLDEKPLLRHAWRAEWKLIVDGENATLRLPNGSGKASRECQLLPLQTARQGAGVEPSRAEARAVGSVINAPIAPKPDGGKQKGTPGRKKIDDRKPLARLVELIKTRSFPSIRQAVDALLDEKVVEVKGASPRAIYERLREQLNESHFVDESNPEGVTLTARVQA